MVFQLSNKAKHHSLALEEEGWVRAQADRINKQLIDSRCFLPIVLKRKLVAGRSRLDGFDSCYVGV
jgi:hypothetical protein